MKQASLAILLKPKGGGDDKGGDAPDAEEEAGEGDDSSEDYQALAEEAFPDEKWTPDRLAAFKELVMSCMGKD